MLSSDPKRLRLLGIDLHSRLRRRAAVVLTYTVYIFGVEALCTIIEYNQRLWLQYVCIFVWTILIGHMGIFRSYGPVKQMNEQTTYRDRIVLSGLDDWSRYLYGGTYDILAPDQQHDVLQRYKVGNYILPAAGRHPGFDTNAPDEREVVERNRAYTRALQLMTTFLFSLTGLSIADAANHRSFGDIPSTLMALGLAAITLPKAIILWNESDPRALVLADKSAGILPESINPSRDILGFR